MSYNIFCRFVMFVVAVVASAVIFLLCCVKCFRSIILLAVDRIENLHLGLRYVFHCPDRVGERIEYAKCSGCVV